MAQAATAQPGTAHPPPAPADAGYRPLSRRQLAWRAAQAIGDGCYVNLGIGLPTLCANFLPADREIVIHSENGILGVGPYPPQGMEDLDLVNAGKEFVTLLPGGAYFVHSDSFAMIRGGHLDYALLGAFEVAVNGDLANWTTGDPRFPPGVGGAMDLAVGAREVWVLTGHVTRSGAPKLVNRCSYPLTGHGCVKRVFTDLAVIDLVDGTALVREKLPGLSLRALQEVTGPPLTLAPDCRDLTAPAL